VLVDPLEPVSIAAGIAEASSRRDELVALGLERARTFTWERAADAVEALWRELA
jgi:glycosyltransferase involved in cell wall biosynthesis